MTLVKLVSSFWHVKCEVSLPLLALNDEEVTCVGVFRERAGDKNSKMSLSMTISMPFSPMTDYLDIGKVIVYFGKVASVKYNYDITHFLL